MDGGIIRVRKNRRVTGAMRYWGEGPQLGPPGYENNLLYIAGLVALILGAVGASHTETINSKIQRMNKELLP